MLFLLLVGCGYAHSPTTLALKDLFILRHAEAVFPEPEVGDAARPLTAKGMRDATALGAYWNQQGILFSKIMASPAVRTANTAATVVAHMPQVDQSVSLLAPLYEGSINTFVTMIHTWQGAWHQVLLVSHKPLISTVLTYLTGEQLLLPPCGYAQVRLDTASWQEVKASIGKLISTGSPEYFTTS